MSLELFINSGSISEIDLSRIDGVRFEDALSVASTTCASLYYNTQEFSIPPITPPGTLNIPQTNYFMFDDDASSDWNASTPTKIRISLKAIGRIIDRTSYQQKLFDIIKNSRVDSEITLTKMPTLNEADPTSFKKFKVVEANYLERTYDESGQKFYALEWGTNDLTETADLTGLFDYFPSSDDQKDGFFTLTVTQIDGDVNSAEPPQQGDELLICITPSSRYGFLDVVDANFDNINIENVDVTSGSMDSLEVSQSMTMRGEHLMTIIGNDPKTIEYTTFKFNEAYWDIAEVYQGTPGEIPSEGYFLFNENSSVNGEYGESQWRNSKPISIRISANASDPSMENALTFKNKLFEILKNRYAKSKITFFQQMSNMNIGTQAYKEFEIQSMFYVEKRDRNNDSKIYKMDWGDKDIKQTQDLFGYFDEYTQPLVKGEKHFGDPGISGFFELQVKQLNPAINYTYSEPPIQDQEFKVVVDVIAAPSKEITLITQSQTYTIPSWAKKLTIYALGGGGGGGAGSNGFGHNTNSGLLEGRWIDPVTGTIFYSELDDDGDPLHYDKIGHDFVLGGGGGAGGSVVIAEYDIKSQAINVDDLNIQISKLESDESIIIGEINAKKSGPFGYLVEGIKELEDELIIIQKELRRLKLEREQRLGGIPAGSELSIYVGSGGKGGEGRKSVVDSPLETDVIRIGNTNTYRSKTYGSDNMWASLWFQREHVRITSKNNAVSVGIGIAPKDTSIADHIFGMATDYLSGIMMVKITDTIVDAIDSALTPKGYKSTLLNDERFWEDFNKLEADRLDMGDDLWRERIQNIDVMEQGYEGLMRLDEYYNNQFDVLGNRPKDFYGPSPGMSMRDAAVALKFKIKTYAESFSGASLNEVVEYLNSKNFEYLTQLKLEYDTKFWESYYLGRAVPNPSAGWRDFILTYNQWQSKDIDLIDLIRQKTMIDMIEYVNGTTDAINDIMESLKQSGLELKDIVDRTRFFDALCIDRAYYDAFTGNGHFAKFYTPFGNMRWSDFESLRNSLAGLYRADEYVKSLIYSNSVTSNYYGRGPNIAQNIFNGNASKGFLSLSGPTTTSGEALFQTINNVGMAFGKAGLNLLLPGAGTAITIGKMLYDILTDSDKAVAFTPINVSFSKRELVKPTLNNIKIPRFFEISDPIEYTYHTQSSRFKSDKFYLPQFISQSLDDSKFHGKNGGNTEVYIVGNANNQYASELILRASGGIGGSGGYALRGMLNPFFRSYGKNFDAYFNLVVPGGYGPTQLPFAVRNTKCTVSNGGPGAYGVASPTFTGWELTPHKDYEITLKEKDYWYKKFNELSEGLDTSPEYLALVDEAFNKLNELNAKLSTLNPSIDFKNLSLHQNTFKANVAISLPAGEGSYMDFYANPLFYQDIFYGKSSPTHINDEFYTVHQIDGFLGDRSPGLGYEVIGSSDNIITNDSWSTINSTKPIPTPPGGGGGCGITWQLLDRRDTRYPYFYASNQQNLVDQYKIQSNALSNQVYLGLGGKLIYPFMNTSAYLFSDIDPLSGQKIEIKIEAGGNGAFGNYYTTDGQQIFARKQVENESVMVRNPDPTISYQLAENVSNRWGVGGGGGAAYYVTDWNSKPIVGNIDFTNPNNVIITDGSNFYDSIQDGADGGPGVVVIVAEP